MTTSRPTTPPEESTTSTQHSIFTRPSQLDAHNLGVLYRQTELAEKLTEILRRLEADQPLSASKASSTAAQSSTAVIGRTVSLQRQAAPSEQKAASASETPQQQAQQQQPSLAGAGASASAGVELISFQVRR